MAIAADGGVTYRGKFVDPEDLPGLLKDSGLTKQDTIFIHIPEDIMLGTIFMQLTRVGLKEYDNTKDKRIIRPIKFQ